MFFFVYLSVFGFLTEDQNHAISYTAIAILSFFTMQNQCCISVYAPHKYNVYLYAFLNLTFLFKVKLKTSISSIISLDKTNGRLIFNGRILAVWSDVFLTWNEEKFGNITRIETTRNQIWVPVFRHMCDTSLDLATTALWLNSNGTVHMSLVGRFVAHCGIDIKFYPTDETTCISTITTTGFGASHIRMLTLIDRMELKDFIDHSEWDITETNASIFRHADVDINMELDAYKLVFILNRRVGIKMLNAVLPAILIAILNMFIYIVPVESGERISFSVTVLLAYIFFTTVIEVPTATKVIPNVAIMLSFMNCLCAFNVIVSVIFCRISTEAIAPIPLSLKRLVLRTNNSKQNNKLLFSFLRSKKSNSNTKPSNPLNDSTEHLETSETSVRKHAGVNREDANKNATDAEMSWADVIHILDVIMFFIHLVVMFVSAITFSLYMYVNKP